MENELVDRVKANLNYQKLVSTRSSYGWMLTAIMVVVFYGFILLVAFNKELLSTRIGSSVITWGIPIGLFVIVFTVILTGIYVARANGQFDELTAKVRDEVQL